MQYLIDLWEKEGEFFDIEGVSFWHTELSRLLHFEGQAAYINDNIIDCISNLMNNQEGDFWTMPSHAYGEYIREDLGIGQVGGEIDEKMDQKNGERARTEVSYGSVCSGYALQGDHLGYP